MFLKSIFTPAQQRHLFDAFCTFQKFEVCALLQNVGVFYFSLHVMKNEKKNNMIFLYIRYDNSRSICLEH